MEQKFILNSWCLLLVTSICAAIPQQMAGLSEFQAATLRVAAKNTLRYREMCSHEDEKKRHAIGEKLVDMVYEMDFSQLSPIALDMDRLVESSKGDFCNTIENLQCQSTGLCGCASGESMGVKVRSIREDGACRLAAGSACAPPSTFQVIGTEKPDLRCQADSECIHISDESPCTEAGMQNELILSFGGAQKVQNDHKGFLAHTKKKMAQGICVCSGEAENGSVRMTSVNNLIFGLFGILLIWRF